MLKSPRVFFFLVCLISLLEISMVPVDAQTIRPAEVTIIIKRLQSFMASNPPDSGTVQDLLHSMQPNGSWENIDYKSVRISHWQASSHLACVLSLAKAYVNKQSSFYKDKNLGTAIHRSLNFWLEHNFTSQNWWANDIGVPNLLTDILILINDEITQKELLRALNQMRGTYISQTGQNRVWRAEIQLKIGLLEYGKGRTNLLGSPQERIQNAVHILKQEVAVRAEEGIQPDWSFHQHGVQQQFGNYGLSFASTQAEWAWILKGTSFQYDKEKMGILRNYILNGLSLVVWKGYMDISGAGRQLFPNSLYDKGESVIRILELMSKTDSTHESAYQQVIAFNMGKSQNPLFLKGSNYFWRSDLMVNRSDKSYISVRMCSKKIQSTESINGENILGDHLSDGATYIYRTGKEYQNIFPVWNWHKIPGVTSFTQNKLPPLSGRGLPNGSDFVGGVSDSTYGIASMLYERNGLTAHKSWFFTPQGIVCLGSGISSNKNTNVSTTVNQCLLTGNVAVKTNKHELTITDGHKLNSEDIEWAYQDNVGYLFLQNEKVHISAENQGGNWSRVFIRGSKKPMIKKVFSVWIDHGNQPKNQSYAYVILPNVNKQTLDRYTSHLPFKVLQNDTVLQAIQYPDKRLTQSVFYHAGEVNISQYIILKANAPCLVLVRQINRGIGLTVSAPPELERTVVLTLSGQYRGENCSYDANNHQTKVVFHLPGGMYAGQSVTKDIITQ